MSMSTATRTIFDRSLKLTRWRFDATLDLVGASDSAAKHAVETAAATLRDLRVGEVVKLDVTIDDGHVTHYRARVAISFKYEHGN